MTLTVVVQEALVEQVHTNSSTDSAKKFEEKSTNLNRRRDMRRTVCFVDVDSNERAFNCYTRVR